MNTKVATIISLVAIVFVGGFFVMKVSYGNREVELTNLIETKQTDNTNVYDAMWKIIKQNASVTDEYKKAFKEIYPDLIAGRYSGEGKPLMKWIQESNPDFDTALYSKLMVSIEAQRTNFRETQTSLLDFKREYDNLRLKFPSKYFVSGNEIEITIVTSDKTEEIFNSGKDNDVSLFN